MIAKFIATGFGLGLLPKAPGTWGSLGALPLGYLLHRLGGFPLVLPATALLTLIGWIATVSYLKATGGEDPSEVVIDEIVGQLIALWPLSLGLWMRGVDPAVFPWPGWMGGFLMFRLFDILKPGPVGWADRKPGAVGVMLDDIIAGVFAALVVTVAAAIAHGMLIR